MKQTENNRTNPSDYLYDVCYRKRNGQEKTLCEGVSIKKCLKVIRNYKRLLKFTSLEDDILYIFLIPKL